MWRTKTIWCLSESEEMACCRFSRSSCSRAYSTGAWAGAQRAVGFPRASMADSSMPWRGRLLRLRVKSIERLTVIR